MSDGGLGQENSVTPAQAGVHGAGRHSSGRLMESGVPVAWTELPFDFYRGRVFRDVMPLGLSIAEIVARIPNPPVGFERHGFVCVNDVVVPRHLWNDLRPGAEGRARGAPVSVTLHAPAGRGRGGSGGGKRIFAIIAAIALIALTAWIGGGGLLAAGIVGQGSFLATAFGSKLLAAGIGLVGQLALRALTPPPAEETLSAQPNGAAAAGNLIARGATLPCVVGTHRVFPSFLCEPRIEISGDDMFVTAVWGLAGPHLLEDIEIGGVPIEDMEDIEVETREGWDDDVAITLATMQSHTVAPNLLLTTHKWSTVGTITGGFWRVEDQAVPDNSVPVWHRVVTRDDADRIELHLTFNDGLLQRGGAFNTQALMPMRIRMRLVGEATWINLPEIWWYGDIEQSFRKAIHFIWDLAFTDDPSVQGNGERPRYAYVETPAQTSPAAGSWTANAYFNDGAGDTYLSSANVATTRLRRIALLEDSVEFYMRQDLGVVFPRGRYEIEIKRGTVVATEQWSASAYEYDGNVYDPFYYKTSGGVDQMIRWTEQDLGWSLTVDRVVSAWNGEPVEAGAGLAVIAIRARNRSVEQLSVLASGYVEDLDGGDWDNWVTTSNPAPHYRRVLIGELARKPLSALQLDDDGIEDWRTYCDDEGLEVNAILDGGSVADALNIIASCGYGRPMKSEKWGVAIDRNRLADDPVQVFSPRNMASFRWTKAFADLPDHLIVTFRDREANYDEREIIVYADGYDAGSAVLPESVSYVGLDTEAAAIRRAEFDHRQARHRSAIYVGNVGVENFVSRRGDLVAVQHDTLGMQAGASRIKEVVEAGGNVTGLKLRGVIPVGLDDDGNPDVAAVTGIAVRLRDGSRLVKQLVHAGAETDEVSFATPFAVPGGGILAEDCLVVSGPLGHEYRRLVVADVLPGPDLTAEIAFLDEVSAELFGAFDPLAFDTAAFA